MGRPPIYNNPEELQSKIDEYFDIGMTRKQVEIKGTSLTITIDVPTITGLIRYVGFESRQSFYDMEKREGFTYTIKRARQRIEQHYEELLQRGIGAGAIFALKNFGWTDKTEVEHTGEIKHVQMGTVVIETTKQDGSRNRFPLIPQIGEN